MACTPAVAGAMDHAVEADRRDEKSSIIKVRSSFAVSAFHRNATSLVERFTMGDVCLTAWKRKDMGLPFPGIRLTRCCVRLILLPTELHGRSRFSAKLLQLGDPSGCSPCRWLYLTAEKPVCH